MELVNESTISATKFHTEACPERLEFASRQQRTASVFSLDTVFSAVPNGRDITGVVWHDLLRQMMEHKPAKQILGLRASLWAIVLLGTGLRFLNLGRQSVWIDEGFSWLASRMNFGAVTRLAWEDVHPPLYYYLLKASLWVFPDTEFGLRLVSVLCSIASLVVLITFVYRHWGHRAACYVGLLAALSPFDIYYAREARMYALLSFLFVLAYTELVESLAGKPAHLIGWVAANVGLAWTHAYGLLAAFLQIGFFVGYWIWLRLRGRPFPLTTTTARRALEFLLVGIAPIVIFFWLIRANASSSVLLPETNRLLYLVRCWATGPMHAFPAFKIPWRMHDVSTAVMVGCAVWGARQLWWRDEFHRWALTFALALIVLPAGIIYGYSVLSGHALWIDRGFLGSAHLVYLLAGVGLAAVGSRAVRGLVAVAIGVSLVSGEIYYYTIFEKSQAMTAFHSLPPITAQRTLLVSPPWLEAEAYYYLRSYTSYWGVQSESPWQLLRVTWSPEHMPQQDVTTCDEPALERVSELYAFGDASKIRADRGQWPVCLLGKKIWVFESEHWHPLDE